MLLEKRIQNFIQKYFSAFFRNFVPEFFSGRFDTNGSMIPLLDPPGGQQFLSVFMSQIESNRFLDYRIKGLKKTALLVDDFP